jgi:hypothetical protein
MESTWTVGDRVRLRACLVPEICCKVFKILCHVLNLVALHRALNIDRK